MFTVMFRKISRLKVRLLKFTDMKFSLPARMFSLVSIMARSAVKPKV